MNVEDTKKALADWKYNLCVSCEKDDCEHCVAHLLGHSLNLINRQQAEIERLEDTLKIYHKYNPAIRHAKSEAIKEFAERLKEKGAYNSFNELIIFEDMVDAVKKEMTEEGVMPYR